MVLLRAGNWHVLGRIGNLSVSGAFVRCALPPQGATRVVVDLRMSVGAGEVAAHLIRTTAEGIGIEWTRLAPAAVVRLLTSPPPRRPAVAEADSASRVSAGQ